MTFPAISCGVYGYPLDEGARVAITTIRDLFATAASVERATFVLFSAATERAFADTLDVIWATAKPLPRCEGAPGRMYPS
jgi:O-acetyl-ADP-ribose deacetylase (regulator of RNase III)